MENLWATVLDSTWYILKMLGLNMVIFNENQESNSIFRVRVFKMYSLYNVPCLLLLFDTHGVS